MINLFVIAGCVTPSLASQVLQINLLLLSSVFSGRVCLYESQKNSFIYFAIYRGTFSFIVEGTHFPPPSHKYLFEVGHWFQSFMKLLMRVLIESNHLMLWVRSAFSNILNFAFRNLPIYFAKSFLRSWRKWSKSISLYCMASTYPKTDSMRTEWGLKRLRSSWWRNSHQLGSGALRGQVSMTVLHCCQMYKLEEPLQLQRAPLREL